MRQRKPSSTYGTVRFTGGKAGRCRKIFKNPDFEKGQEYSIDVLFREHPIKAIVQVQTSLSKGADVILYHGHPPRSLLLLRQRSRNNAG